MISDNATDLYPNLQPDDHWDRIMNTTSILTTKYKKSKSNESFQKLVDSPDEMLRVA